jgi:hypothetical protein
LASLDWVLKPVTREEFQLTPRGFFVGQPWEQLLKPLPLHGIGDDSVGVGSCRFGNGKVKPNVNLRAGGRVHVHLDEGLL